MRFILVYILCLGMLSACSNWKEEPAIARIIAVNALPGSSQVDFRYNGQLLQNQSFSYGDFTNGYLTLQAGKRDMTITPTGSTIPVINKPLFLAEFRNYSAFLTRFKLKDTLIVYQDILTTPAAGNARIRFVNLYTEVTDTLRLLALNSNNRVDTLFLNRRFMNISPFTEIDTQPNDYILTVSKNKELAHGLTFPVTLNREISYTILATDTLIGGNKSVKLQRIEHR